MSGEDYAIVLNSMAYHRNLLLSCMLKKAASCPERSRTNRGEQRLQGEKKKLGESILECEEKNES